MVLSHRQEHHLQELIERYTARTRSTKQYTQQYRSVYANNRNVAGFRPILKEMVYQIVSQRADGSKIWDLDGNEYVDLTIGFGVNLFGHNPAFIREKIEAELKNGMCVGPMSNMAGQVAEKICKLTGVERIALYNSGTEAVMVALRLARAATGRAKVAILPAPITVRMMGCLRWVALATIRSIPHLLRLAFCGTWWTISLYLTMERTNRWIIYAHMGMSWLLCLWNQCKAVVPIFSRRSFAGGSPNHGAIRYSFYF